MVWPFTSDSSKDKNDFVSIASSARDSIEHAGQDAKEILQSTKASLEDLTTSIEEMTSTASAASSSTVGIIKFAFSSIPDSVSPYLITSLIFGVGIAGSVFYRKRLRRIPNVEYLTPNSLQGKRVLKGKVTSVGDSDNFRFYHTPGGIWAGWGWLRHVPTGSKELKNQTLHIRLAGIDAPEGAHFGMPAQPFSKESLEWLRKEVNGKTVLVKPYTKDRYDRVVSMAWYPRFLPFLPKKNVSLQLLKVGYAQIYRQHGFEYGDMLDEFERIETKAKRRKIGIWSQENMVSAAEHKKQYLRKKE